VRVRSYRIAVTIVQAELAGVFLPVAAAILPAKGRLSVRCAVRVTSPVHRFGCLKHHIHFVSGCQMF
jgi:hypothetical protein